MPKGRPKATKSHQTNSPPRTKHSHHSKSPKKKKVAEPQGTPPSPPPSTEIVRDIEQADLQRGRDYERDSPVIVFLAGLVGFVLGLLLGLLIALVVSIFVCCCFYDTRGWWRDRKKRAFLIGFILGILVALVVAIIVVIALNVNRDRDVYTVSTGPPFIIS